MRLDAPRRIRARWIVPVSSPPLEDGEVVHSEGRILEVRSRPVGVPAASDALDLGNAAVLPGFVNVHTHLDYTAYRGLLEDLAFVPWIRDLTRRKSALAWDDWVCSATVGAAECLAAGVTTVADCTDTGAALWGADAVGLRGVVYREVFGIDPAITDEDAMHGLQQNVAELQRRARGTRFTVGVSPHSPYTLRPSLLKSIAAWTSAEQLRTCTHVAESKAETDLVESGSGPLAEIFAQRGIEWTPRRCSPVQYLESCGLVTSRSLLVHGVRATGADLALAADRGAAWAHCPKSNAKLGHGAAPLEGMLGAGAVGIGTDSVASNNAVDMFEEMRAALLLHRAATGHTESFSARQALYLSTLGGARALGLDPLVGSLEPGKRADLVGVSLESAHARPVHDPVQSLVWACGARDVRLVMIDGELLARNGRLVRVRLRPRLVRLDSVAARLRGFQGPRSTEGR